MKKILNAVGLVAGTILLLSANTAFARVDVGINIDVPGPYVQPAPIYVEPRPVYVEPRPVYVEPRPVYVQPPQPVYVVPRYVEHHGRHWHGNYGRRDLDRDGVPNRFDRDRDGDGVPNRFDRRPNNPYRY